MYKLHNNIGLIRGHALLQIRNFFPKDNAISRIIGTLQFLSADTSTILRLFLLLRSISISLLTMTISSYLRENFLLNISLSTNSNIRYTFLH